MGVADGQRPGDEPCLGPAGQRAVRTDDGNRVDGDVRARCASRRGSLSGDPKLIRTRYAEAKVDAAQATA